ESGKLRSHHRSDWSRVNGAVSVPSDPLIDRTNIQTSTAAQAVKRLAHFRICEHLSPAVVQQNQMKLVCPICLTRSPRAGDQRNVTRHFLSTGAASQDLEKHCKVGEPRYDFLYADDCNVYPRQTGGQADVALVFNQHDSARLRYGEVGAGDSHSGAQEFLTKPPAC